jgi:hypothetical protein
MYTTLIESNVSQLYPESLLYYTPLQHVLKKSAVEETDALTCL